MLKQYNTALQDHKRSKRNKAILYAVILLALLFSSMYGSAELVHATAQDIYASCPPSTSSPERLCGHLIDYTFEAPERHSKEYWRVYCNQMINTNLACK